MDPMTTGSATLLSNRKTPGIPKKFACLLASNPHPMREQMANELRKVGDVDLYGRAYGKPVASKAHVLSEYRFVITPENDLYPGYVTEKAIEAWLSHTIPIWWGSDPAGYLNPDAVVNAAETSIDGLAEPVRLLDQNKDMWEKMISQPILRESFDYDDCIAFLKRQLQ